MTQQSTPGSGDEDRSFSDRLRHAEETDGTDAPDRPRGFHYDPTTGRVRYFGAPDAKPGSAAAFFVTLENAVLDTPPDQLPSSSGGFSITPETLQTFANKLGGVHTEFFTATAATAPDHAMERTNVADAMGPIARQHTNLHQAYSNYREQILAVLAEMAQRVQDLSAQASSSHSTYQLVEDNIARTMRALGA